MPPTRAMVLPKPNPVCLPVPEGRGHRGAGPTVGVSRVGDRGPAPLQGGGAGVLPDGRGVELGGVEEDAVEGGGEATLADDGQRRAHHLQLWGGEGDVVGAAPGREPPRGGGRGKKGGCRDGQLEWMGGWRRGWVDGDVDGWMVGDMDGWMETWMDGWMDGWRHGWMGGDMDGWMDGLMLET